jgi:hypothetical protein
MVRCLTATRWGYRIKTRANCADDDIGSMFDGQVGGLPEKPRANCADDANGSMLDGAPLGIKKNAGKLRR